MAAFARGGIDRDQNYLLGNGFPHGTINEG
jgi:hypothetical protein